MPKGSATVWVWQDLLLVSGAVLPTLFLASIAAHFVSDHAVKALVTQSLFYALLSGALYASVALRVLLHHGGSFLETLGFVPCPNAWKWAAAGPGLALGVGVIAVALRTPQVPLPIEPFLSTGAGVAVTAVFVVLLGPLFEEMMFRGFLLPLLSRSIGDVAACLLSAASLALLHGPEYRWAWQQVVLLTLVFAACGYARVRTTTTTAAFLLHAGFNMFEFAGFLATRSGHH